MRQIGGVARDFLKELATRLVLKYFWLTFSAFNGISINLFSLINKIFAKLNFCLVGVTFKIFVLTWRAFSHLWVVTEVSHQFEPPSFHLDQHWKLLKVCNQVIANTVLNYIKKLHITYELRGLNEFPAITIMMTKLWHAMWTGQLSCGLT